MWVRLEDSFFAIVLVILFTCDLRNVVSCRCYGHRRSLTQKGLKMILMELGVDPNRSVRKLLTLDYYL